MEVERGFGLGGRAFGKNEKRRGGAGWATQAGCFRAKGGTAVPFAVGDDGRGGSGVGGGGSGPGRESGSGGTSRAQLIALWDFSVHVCVCACVYVCVRVSFSGGKDTGGGREAGRRRA